MPTVKFEVEGFRCERCGHQWVPMDKEREPRVCPRCKTPYWNIKRKKDK
jgi:predicted Zn-ribbon and HTH transcriptional regulator